MSSPFDDERLAFGTRHDKGSLVEGILAPCGLRVVEVPIDTDRLGTFTPERPRRHDEIRTAAIKASRASRRIRSRLGLGSEGTFRPHPAAPSLSINIETLVLRDRPTRTLIVEREVSTTTAPRQAMIGAEHPLASLLEEIGFPSQGIVLSAPSSSCVQIKGIADHHALAEAIAQLGAGPDGEGLLVTTDLRAHLCPARQLVIARCAKRLAKRLSTPCPSCHSPGFGVIGSIPGLPCSACSAPTAQPRAQSLACPWCGNQSEHIIEAAADPSQCPRCNP